MKEVCSAIISRTNEKGEKEFLLCISPLDYGKFTGQWYGPSGHIKENKNQKDFLKRKIKIELNIDIEPIKLIYEGKGDAPGYYVYFWECAVKSTDFKVNKEHLVKAGFFTEKEIKKMKLWPATKKVFEEIVFKQEK